MSTETQGNDGNRYDLIGPPKLSGESNLVAETTSIVQALSGHWQDSLRTESYEEASEALFEIQALRKWRQAATASRFPQVYSYLENLSQIQKNTDAGDAPKLRQELVEAMTLKARNLTPRVADFYLSLLERIEGQEVQPRFEINSQKIKQLEESGDLSLLSDPRVPFEVKQNRIQTRLEGFMAGLQSLDRREKQQDELEWKEKQDQQTEEETNPSPDSDESKPGMDEMERSPEGEEVPAIWTISPAYGGYFKEQSFDTWDAERNVWKQSDYQFEEPGKLFGSFAISEEITVTANMIPGRWTRLAIPYGFEITNDASYASQGIKFKRDNNGDYRVYLDADQTKMVNITLNDGSDRFSRVPKVDIEPMPINVINNSFPDDFMDQARDRIAKKQGIIAKAKALSCLVMQRLTYSNDSSFNQIYESHPMGYIAAIDEHRQADCDVANTYFAALCAQFGIPARHVVGHMVKGKDKEGNSRITSGTGHAWTEVWDEKTRNWVRIDATPPGDSQLEDEEGEAGEPIPGDYGEKEAVGPTDEELQVLEQQLMDLTEKLSYTNEERILAEATGIDLKEARGIIGEIREAEDTRLKGGERVMDVLAKMFAMIIESRRTQASEYSGPLRKSEGGESISDIVAHKIGILAHDMDPTSREKELPIQKQEQVFGGFDFYSISDKSYSMSEVVDGESKLKLQRLANYLITSSLYRFEQNARLSGVVMSDPLSVRTQAISFRNKNTIDVDKPLSGDFSMQDRVNMWRSLDNLGMGNGDVAALNEVYDQILKEKQEIESRGEIDNRLRIVIACSDGYPDDVEGVHRLAQALGELNVVVVGIGLTETASKVPIIFDTPYSRGDIAIDINDLPLIVAKHVITEALRLFPERSKKQFSGFLDALTSKFDGV